MSAVQGRARRRASLAARIGAAAAVIAVVVAGIWVSGGLITNDFALAMVLTAVWMGVAALASAAVAWRRRDLAVPVLGAYLVTAGVIGVYLAQSTLIDNEVNERVVVADARNELLARGGFEPVTHSAAGTASTIRGADGKTVLTLTDFEVDNGPDLRVYLVAGPARDESGVDDHEDLGGLKGNKGNQQYEIPADVDLSRYTTVVIWCRAFSVNFARAPLR